MKILNLSALALLILAGCTPGDDGTLTLEGRVADGYLVGALVCLDVNNNAHCDDNEPDTTTTAGGQYRLEDITQAQYQQGQLLVEVSTSAQDEDNNSFVPYPFKLTTPKGHETFISPITTLIARAMQLDPKLSQAAALERFAVAFGQENSDSLLEDFVAKGADGDLAAQQLHSIARVIAEVQGEAGFKLAGEIQANNNNPDQYAMEIELALAKAISQNTDESFNLRQLKLAANETDASKRQDKIRELLAIIQAQATVAQTKRLNNFLASNTLNPGAVIELATKGFGNLSIFSSEKCTDSANEKNLGCFYTRKTKATATGNDNTLSSLEKFYDLDENGQPTIVEDNDNPLEEIEGSAWILNENDEFEAVNFIALWHQDILNSDGSLSSHTVYLKNRPTTPQANWTLANLKPFAVAIDTETTPLTVRAKSVASESLVDVLERMSADEDDVLGPDFTEFAASQSFPADAVGYWFTVSRSDNDLIIDSDSDNGSDSTVRFITSEGQCDEDCKNTVISNLDDLFTLTDDTLGVEAWGYLNNEEDLYTYRIGFNRSDTSQPQGTAVLSRWHTVDYVTVQDKAFAGELTWQRHDDWHGKDAIVFDRIQAHEYGLQTVAIVDISAEQNEPVMWAKLKSANEPDSYYMLNASGLGTLIEPLSEFFSENFDQ